MPKGRGGGYTSYRRPARSTRFRPLFLATYKAASACPSSSPTVAAVSGHAATPNEAESGQA